MTRYDQFIALACELSRKTLRRHLKVTTGCPANDNAERVEEWR